MIAPATAPATMPSNGHTNAEKYLPRRVLDRANVARAEAEIMSTQIAGNTPDENIMAVATHAQ